MVNNRFHALVIWRTYMKELEDRIRKDGIVREGNVLKVDNFLNTSATCRCTTRWAPNGHACLRASASTKS